MSSTPLAEARAAKTRKQLSGSTPSLAATGAAEPAPVVLSIVRASAFAGQPVPPRRWYLPGIIPGRTVTMLGGDGASGKSTVAEQLAVAGVAGSEWLGMRPEVGGVIIFSAEDDIDEVQRRCVDIAAGAGVDLACLDALVVVPLAGMDAVLGAPDKTGSIVATPMWKALGALVADEKPRLVILDTLADVFGGDEISRRQTRQFVTLLRGLAIQHDLAVLLLAHPSLDGLKSGTGTSGSTAWNNSVRARLYLETIKDGEGHEIDADIRVLRVKKSNYGPVNFEARLRRLAGYYVIDGPAGGGFLNKVAADAKAEGVFLSLLAKLTEQGRDVSAKASRSYAPTVFAAHPNADGMGSKVLLGAMERLLSAHLIHIEKSGPPSKERSRLVAGPPKEIEP